MKLFRIQLFDVLHDFFYLHTHFDLPQFIKELVVLPLVWLTMIVVIIMVIKAIRTKTNKRRIYIRVIFAMITILLLIMILFL
jgi:hypothetical protein